MGALGLRQFAARFKQLPTQEADALTSLAEPPRDPMERHAIVLAHRAIVPLTPDSCGLGVGAIGFREPSGEDEAM
jgi:hypothetical protein